MRRMLLGSMWVLLAVVAAGCASAGGGASSSEYTRDMGRLLVPTLEEARLKIFQKHNWNVRREEAEQANIYWETDWRAFEPPGDGGAMSPTEARGRIILRGRSVGSDLDGGLIYRVTFVGEYEVRGGASSDWRPAPLTDAARGVFRTVAGDLALEVNTGVRR